MNKYPGFISLAAVLALTACTGGDVSSRNAATPLTGAAQPARGVVIAQPLYTVQALRVSVPRTLKVSEANMFYPIADIVWRGDPRGDRHAQVEALMTAALTEKARVTTGGVHAIRFVLTVRDARSGAVLDGPRMVNADFPAWGGKRALEAEARGITEKVQIGERLKSVILRELSAPVSGTAPDLVSQAPLHPAEAMLQN